MVLLISKFIQFFKDVDWTKRDPTMEHLFLMGSPLPMLLITACYLILVLKLGPAFMRNRKPYNLKYIILIYNIIQILLNFYNGLRALWLTLYHQPYDFGCMMPIPLDTDLGQIEKQIIYNYYLLKILDLMDTVFFVLRKNFKQVSFLHVYHHSALVVSTYCILAYFRCGGHMSSLGIMNMIVHGFMYSYYMLSAIDKRLVWWKKYITMLQIVQFLVLIGHSLWPLIMRPDCSYPKMVILLMLFQAVFMLYLFSKFYWKTYIRKSKSNADSNKNN